MVDPSSQTLHIQACLDRIHGGDQAARGELLSCACERLRNLARKMLRGYPNVRRWEQTDDVLQNAALRLHRTLQQLPVQTALDFFRLAALNIRRELLDLAKHHYGPRGQGAHHATWDSGDSSTTRSDSGLAAPPDPSDDPARLAAWGEFHEQIGALPDKERAVFDLIWYQGLSQAEAATLLNVSERTVKRRWQAARLMLHEALAGEVPE
jgi:RNA polymerase sigma-70 factor (ECF subfamily)